MGWRASRPPTPAARAPARAGAGGATRALTLDVVTLWYRCPELLLGASTYDAGVDSFALGCVLGELCLGRPLWAGAHVDEQLALVAGALGIDAVERLLARGRRAVREPSALAALPRFDAMRGAARGELADARRLRALIPDRPRMLPSGLVSAGACLSPAGFELLFGLLNVDPVRRWSAADALREPYFTEAPSRARRAGMSRTEPPRSPLPPIGRSARVPPPQIKRRAPRALVFLTSPDYGACPITARTRRNV